MIKKDALVLFILLLLASLLGMALVTYATTFGPGVGGDATIYLTSAQNLLAGNGLGWTEADGSFRLLPYTPPFYPLVLSALGLLVRDMVAGARWLNVILFGATIALAGLFFYRNTGRLWLAAIFSGLLAASPVIVGVQVWAMSESLFLLLGFSGLLVLLDYLACPRRALLIASAGLCGLAFLTRYFGVAFVATGGLALLLFGRGQDSRVKVRLAWNELREAALFGAVAVLPTLIWLVIDFSLTGTVSSRSGQPAAAYWQRFLEIGPALQKIILFWLLPDSIIARLPGIVAVALWLVPLAGLVGLEAFLVRRLNTSQPAAARSSRQPLPSTGRVYRRARHSLCGAVEPVYYRVSARSERCASDDLPTHHLSLAHAFTGAPGGAGAAAGLAALVDGHPWRAGSRAIRLAVGPALCGPGLCGAAWLVRAAQRANRP